MISWTAILQSLQVEAKALWLRFDHRLRVITEHRVQYALACFTLITDVTQSGRKHIEISGIRVFTESQNHSMRTFFRQIATEGIEALQAKLDDLARHLGDDLFKALGDTKYGVKFLKNDIDLIDDAGEIIFRGSKDDIKKFLEHTRKSVQARTTKMAQVNGRLARGWARYRPNIARRKGVNVPLSKPPAAGSSPNFSGTPYLYSGHISVNSAVTKITMTGSRALDFKAAFKAIGINDIKHMEEILLTHTWHHLDDLNPNTLHCTMQLITKKAHRATYKHYGSCKQFKDLLGTSHYR